MKSLCIALAILCCLNLSAAYRKEDTTLTKKQSDQFQKFKTTVIPKLKRDFEKEDFYLLKFFKASGHDAKKAEKYILEESAWRTKENFDNVHKEDWSDMERDYPMWVEGLDKEGRPILYHDVGAFDLRKAVLAGKGKRVVKWFFKNLDEAREKVRQEVLKGRNITRFNYFVNVQGASLATNVNSQGLPIFTEFSTGFIGHFPQMSDLIWLINTPALFETVLTLATTAAPPLKELLRVYPSNADQWGPILRNMVDENQLPRRYGGKAEDRH